MLNDPDTIGRMVFGIYCVIGLPVVLLHMRQQRMLESFDQIRHAQPKNLVICTLAAMWPLLLLAMTLTHLQQKKQPLNFAALEKKAADFTALRVADYPHCCPRAATG